MPATRTRHALIITAALLPLVYWVVWRALTGPFGSEVQSMVIGAVVGSGLGGITGFWLGSSAGSARKDELAQSSSNP